MYRKISGSVGAVIILFVLIHNVHSNPIDSGDIFKLVSKPDNFQRKPSIAGPFRRLFCLDESAIARLSEIADVLVANPNGRRAEARKILIPEKPGTMEVRREWKFSPKVIEKLEFKPRKFHCDPIDDVFIPAVEKKVPAYICKLHDRQFVISSERFLEEFKNHLEIDVDETTFRRLSVDDGTSVVNSVADVIPVTLTQRRGEEFYGVKKG